MSKPGKQEVSETTEISPVLFLDTNGHQMRFYVRPGVTKMQLHPLITNGGGVLCRNQEPGAILLVDSCDVNSAMASAGQRYISAKFIRDCVEQNQLLDLDDYVISVGPSVQTRMAARHQGTGRMCYSVEDDEAILKFMEKRQHEAKGNLVWREMAKRNVTNHSWQSMKDRFLKHLQHKLTERSLKKSPSKRKALSFIQSSSAKKKATDPETEPDTLQNSFADSSETQITTENGSPPLPERTSSPPPPPEKGSSPPPKKGSSPPPERAGSPSPPERAGSPSPPERAGSPSPPERTSSPPPPPEKGSSPPPERAGSPSPPERAGSPSPPERAGSPSPPERASSSAPERASSPPPSPEKASSPPPERASSPPDVPEAASEPPHASSHDRLVLDQEQETPDPEVSKSPRSDEDGDGRDIPDGSNEHLSLNKTKQTTSKTSTAKKLGILAKAAREFEDSDVMDESEEGEDPCEVPILEPSDAQESSASPATLAREPERQAERHEEARRDSPEPEEEQRPHPGSTASNAHAFMFDSESQEQNLSPARAAPEETPSRILEDVKEHVRSLMRETKKDLVEVTKALLKASGDLTNARVFLLDGYEPEVHGPLWSHLDDEILLLDDPYELEQLQSKFGEQEVTRRRVFLTAGKN